MTLVERIKRLLAEATPQEREAVFRHLRPEFSIHPLEERLGASAEVILEAIARASDLTRRGIRGVIAEAAFAMYVVAHLSGWVEEPIQGDAAYDSCLRDHVGRVRVQVKLQRQRQHRPMKSEEAPRWTKMPPGMFVVETQRTRTGKTRSGDDTRPYRFGEFDILAVSMHPSTGRWDSFMYTVAAWLVPDPTNPALIQKYQPVAAVPDQHWTSDFLEAVDWLRSGVERPLRYQLIEP